MNGGHRSAFSRGIFEILQHVDDALQGERADLDEICRENGGISKHEIEMIRLFGAADLLLDGWLCHDSAAAAIQKRRRRRRASKMEL